jgi:hypothetical protein
LPAVQNIFHLTERPGAVEFTDDDAFIQEDKHEDAA